jgi:hypothetical protein
MRKLEEANTLLLSSYLAPPPPISLISFHTQAQAVLSIQKEERLRGGRGCVRGGNWCKIRTTEEKGGPPLTPSRKRTDMRYIHTLKYISNVLFAATLLLTASRIVVTMHHPCQSKNTLFAAFSPPSKA